MVKVTIYIPRHIRKTSIMKNLRQQVLEAARIREVTKREEYLWTLFSLINKIEKLLTFNDKGKTNTDYIVLADGCRVLVSPIDSKRVERWIFHYGERFVFLKEYL